MDHIDSPDSGKFSIKFGSASEESDIESEQQSPRKKSGSPVKETPRKSKKHIVNRSLKLSLEDDFEKRISQYDNQVNPKEAETMLSDDPPAYPEFSTPKNHIDHTTLQIEDPAEDDKESSLQEKMWLAIDDLTSDLKITMENHSKQMRWLGYICLLVGWLIILILACHRDLSDAMVILILTVMGLLIYIYVTIRDIHGAAIAKYLEGPLDSFSDSWRYLRWPFYIGFLAAIVVGTYFLTKENPSQLISAVGLLFFIIFTYITSHSPRHVQWRPVIWGLVLQFLLGIFILRTKIGFLAFQWIGDVVHIFLDYSDAGAKFVFGDPSFLDHFFAFKVLPVVIYFSAVISVLYYLEIMQVIIGKIAWLMEKTMRTSAPESLNAAGNIFVGQTEAPLLIRPLLKDMTKSELHAVMTGGFATIAGGVLGAYIAFGISASHLISASVMSAPAALAISKLFYPEKEKGLSKKFEEIDLPKGDQRNVIEAASHGAYTAIPLALNIAGNLIAFTALLAFFNGVIGYIGMLIGVPQLSFEFLCSYAFMPVAFMMGVDWEDCGIVAELIGLKTFINEFVAYERLSEFIKAGQISVRSEVIATYALCGFANFSSIGIQLGGLTPMAPTRKSDLAEVALRALVAGTIACFMTACVAGVLYNPDDNLRMVLNNTMTDIPMDVTGFTGTTMVVT